MLSRLSHLYREPPASQVQDSTFVHACSTAEDCQKLVERPLQAHHATMQSKNHTRGASTALKACRGAEAKLAALRRASPALNASAYAEAIISACSHGKWSRGDSRIFLDHAWLPTSQCRSMTRLGPQFTNTREGDGGKTVCDPDRLRRAIGPCVVVSVGLKDDTRFESGLHQLAPHCAIHGYDGTLTRAKAKLVPSYISLRPNFEVTSWRDYPKTRVQILKVDCEGCEAHTVPPWVDNVCTDQLMVEVHTPMGGSSPWDRVQKVNRLMKHLDARGYDVFALEPNPVYPENCWEWSLVRRTPCPQT